MVGVLSLQGSFAEHLEALKRAGIDCLEVRTITDLSKCTGLIMPGGESTTIGKLLVLTGLDKEIAKRFSEGSLKIWGTCAGAILCADKVVSDNPVLNLGLADYSISRNAYGNQLDSFETCLDLAGIKVECAFIRAPKIVEFSEDFEVLAYCQKEAVFLRKGNLLISTCHPELYENKEFYGWLRAWMEQG